MTTRPQTPETEPAADGYACRLDPAELGARQDQGKALRARLSHIDRGARDVRLTFDAAAEPLVRQFVRDESRCCGFFDFAVEPTGEAVVLTVTAPADGRAQAQLDQLYRSSRDGMDGSEPAGPAA